MELFAQADLPMKVVTPLDRRNGGGTFQLIKFTGEEGLSRLFEFHLELAAENSTRVPFDRLLGQGITVTLEQADGSQRYFDGIARSLSEGDRNAEYTSYHMELVPKQWLLTLGSRRRIFEDKTAPEILRSVLRGYPVEWRLDPQAHYPRRAYCVQYGETDFQFLSRLMEEEGISYFFTHAASGHTMVIGNYSGAHRFLTGEEPIPYDVSEESASLGECISHWEKTQTLTETGVRLWDYCFEEGKTLEAAEPILPKVAVGGVWHELHLGGERTNEENGAFAKHYPSMERGKLARIRAEETAARAITIRGTSNCRHLVTGHKFTLLDHWNASSKPNNTYVLTGLVHDASQPVYRSGSKGEEEGFRYRNSFTSIPWDPSLPFRPSRSGAKPRVLTCETATVFGDEEIHTDKYGRVRVRFHWQVHERGKSCWIRVGTPWAGNRWGAVHIPRKGQEVIVAFLEGDPDRPVIIGCLYNEKNRPTYQLPEGRALSGLRSESGGDNSNEIVFDDANGEELIGIHAAKDFRLTAHETIVLEAPGGFLRIGKEGVTVKSDTPLTWLNCGPGEKDVEAPWE